MIPKYIKTAVSFFFVVIRGVSFATRPVTMVDVAGGVVSIPFDAQAAGVPGWAERALLLGRQSAWRKSSPGLFQEQFDDRHGDIRFEHRQAQGECIGADRIGTRLPVGPACEGDF